MYYGKMTKKLEKLYSEYEKVWGHDPSGCLDAEYAGNEYAEYVKDIKKALEMGVELPDIYPHDDEY
ncbi:MAG: hypothetical protein K2J39_13080 [Ruminococcus sp.]|nr:hypothetical protein [Ruminococcus sp.]